MSLLSPNLEAFVAIVKNKTVNGAAREIGLTQTAITQRIRALESMLSTTLFTRSRKGMLMTQEGESLLRYCQAALDLEGETLAKIQGIAKLAEIRVAITGPTSVMTSRIIPQCLEVIRVHPQLVMTFEVSDIERRAEALRTGQVQFAIVPPEQVANEMESKRLKPEQYILVGPKSWRKRDLRDIVREEPIIDFDPTDSMSFSYLKKFKLHHLVGRDRHFVNNNESLIEMFKQGIGYGVLTKEVAAPHLKDGALIELNPGSVFENYLALAWYPRPQRPSYFSALIKVIT
jgi:LysR family transcriptional regulator, chromosome initiation inhibitor